MPVISLSFSSDRPGDQDPLQAVVIIVGSGPQAVPLALQLPVIFIRAVPAVGGKAVSHPAHPYPAAVQAGGAGAVPGVAVMAAAGAVQYLDGGFAADDDGLAPGDHNMAGAGVLVLLVLVLLPPILVVFHHDDVALFDGIRRDEHLPVFVLSHRVGLSAGVVAQDIPEVIVEPPGPGTRIEGMEGIGEQRQVLVMVVQRLPDDKIAHQAGAIVNVGAGGLVHDPAGVVLVFGGVQVVEDGLGPGFEYPAGCGGATGVVYLDRRGENGEIIF